MQLGCCGDTGGIQQGIQIVETHTRYTPVNRDASGCKQTRRVCGCRARDSTRAPHQGEHPHTPLGGYTPDTSHRRCRSDAFTRAGTQLRSAFVLCYTPLHCTVLHHTALHYTVLHWPQHNSPAEKQVCTTVCCAVLCCTALHCWVLTVL